MKQALAKIMRTKELFLRHAYAFRWIVIVQYIIFVLISIYGNLVNPYILTQVFGAVTLNDWTTIMRVCLFGGGLILFFFFLCYINNVYIDLNSFRINLSVKCSLCRTLLSLPYDRISGNFDNADILTRIENGSWAIHDTFLFITLILSNLISLAGLLFLSGATSGVLLLYVAVTVIMTVWITKKEAKAKKWYAAKKQELLSESENIVSLIAGQPAFINMYGIWNQQKELYEKKRDELWNNEWKSEWLSTWVSALMNTVTSLLRGSLGLAFYPLRAAGLLGDAIIAASLSIYDSLRGVISGFSRPFTSLTENFVQVDRLDELTKGDSPIPDKKSSPDEDAAIKICDLTYSTQEGHPILKDISLSIRKGEKTAFIGCNGSGKSTLLKCLCGVYTPQSGVIQILNSGNILDGKARDNGFRRGKINYIPSTAYLYTGSVKENILMNTDDSEEPELFRAAVQAGLCRAEENQMMKASALELSGGQEQRVNIARVLAHKVPVLVADEPLSGLPSAMGDFVLQGILSAAETVVVVTHTPKNLDVFDRIFLMKDGRVAAEGTLQDLQNHPDFVKWSGENK